jgi:hypothetical protein
MPEKADLHTQQGGESARLATAQRGAKNKHGVGAGREN